VQSWGHKATNVPKPKLLVMRQLVSILWRSSTMIKAMGPLAQHGYCRRLNGNGHDYDIA